MRTSHCPASAQVMPPTVPVELFGDARNGDQRAFDAIFRTYQPGLLRYLRAVTPGLANDVASATWESVASSLQRFDGDGADFRKWLFTIARRRLVDELRSSARRPLQLATVPDSVSSSSEAENASDEPDWAVHVLTQIPTRQADVVALRVIGGLAVADTASLLGITADNVRVLSHRGLNAIRMILTSGELIDIREEGIVVVV